MSAILLKLTSDKKKFDIIFVPSTIKPQITGVKFINKATIIRVVKVFFVLKLAKFKAVAKPIYAKPKMKNILVKSRKSVQPI